MSIVKDIAEAINAYPLAGAMVLASLMIVHQIAFRWKGKNNKSKLDNESNKLAKQTNEAINICAQKSIIIMEYFEKHLHEDNVGQISTDITKTVQLLEEVVKHQSFSTKLLARVNNVSDSISDDIKNTDSRMAHAKLMSDIEAVKVLAVDIKRISIHIAEKKEG